MIVYMIRNPFQMMEEGFLICWGCRVVDIRDKTWLVRDDESEGGCDGPFGGEEVI